MNQILFIILHNIFNLCNFSLISFYTNTYVSEFAYSCLIMGAFGLHVSHNVMRMFHFSAS